MSSNTISSGSDTSTPKQIKYLNFVTAVATFGALAFGYDTGVIAGALPFMSKAAQEGGLGLTPFSEGLATSAARAGVIPAARRF